VPGFGSKCELRFPLTFKTSYYNAFSEYLLTNRPSSSFACLSKGQKQQNQAQPLPISHFLYVYCVFNFGFTANHFQVLGPPALTAACFQIPHSVLPFPQTPQSFVILTISIAVAMKLLHLISCLLPGYTWWWNTIFALAKTLKLEGWGCLFTSRVWRWQAQPEDNDRNTADTIDVEMGIQFPVSS